MANEMARWCLATQQTPDVYRSLTRLERQAFVDVINEWNKKKK